MTLGEVAAAVDARASRAGPVPRSLSRPVPVAAGDTLAGRFAVTAAELGETNADADALSPGAAGRAAGRQPGHGAAAHDTLGSIAAAHGTTATWPPPSQGRGGGHCSCFRLPGPAGDTLASVAAAFGVTAADVGAANAAVPGLLVPEQSVLLGQASYPVGRMTRSRRSPPPTALPSPTWPRPTPPPPACSRPGRPSPYLATSCCADGTYRVVAGDTLAAIAGRSQPQVTVTALASANSDVTRLLASDVQLGYTPPGSSATAPPRRRRTPCPRWRRGCREFRRRRGCQQVTVALLAEANPAWPASRRGRRLVPPGDLTFSVPVTASNPEAVFALETAVTLSRTAHVDPALAGAGASDVASVTTPAGAGPAGRGRRADPGTAAVRADVRGARSPRRRRPRRGSSWPRPAAAAPGPRPSSCSPSSTAPTR